MPDSEDTTAQNDTPNVGSDENPGGSDATTDPTSGYAGGGEGSMTFSDPTDDSSNEDDGDEVLTLANARKLRAENASLRARQKEAEAKAAADREAAVKAAVDEATRTSEERLNSLSLDIVRSLGFEVDGEDDANDTDSSADEPVDTEALVREALEAADKKAKDEIGKHQRAARDAQVDSLLYRNAAGLGIDPVAVLDSRAFRAAVDKLDYSADDFADLVKKAASAAAESNPRLRSEPDTPSRSSGGPGGNGTGDQPPADDIEAMRTKYRDKMLNRFR